MNPNGYLGFLPALRDGFDADGCTMVGSCTSGGGVLSGCQGAIADPAADNECDAVAPPERALRLLSIGYAEGTLASSAKWRAVPDELGPWWKAAQTFIRWSKLGMWERLLTLAQERSVQLGMAFLDGTNIGLTRRRQERPKSGHFSTARRA